MLFCDCVFAGCAFLSVSLSSSASVVCVCVVFEGMPRHLTSCQFVADAAFFSVGHVCCVCFVIKCFVAVAVVVAK